jgi:FKBP-type peptidyl-prolyl cis-trans isomerase
MNRFLLATAFLIGTQPTRAQDPPSKPRQIPECAEMKTTASGLQYGVLRKGRAEPSPTGTDLVEVHYTGWLANGKQFDSSRDQGESKRFALDEVMKGLTEGWQLMTPGAHFKFVIPPALGYGEQDQGVIPPNSTLVFEVELLRVLPQPGFRPAGKEQRPLRAGGRYEVVKPGTGSVAAAGDGLAFRYAIFETNGELFDWSERRNDHRLAGNAESLPFAFLKELGAMARLGDVFRVEVPKAGANLGRDTVWELELVGLSTVPKWRPSDPKNIVTTQSGLQYEMLRMGTGRRPKVTDTVVAHYTGWLADGTPFDSSHSRGTPREGRLDDFIKGWIEGLQLLQVGGAAQFTIPPHLAFGEQGRPPQIPGNATVVFYVELIAVK